MNEKSTIEMRESEIRPEHLMQEQAARFAADIGRLLKHKGEFVHVGCPACGSESAEKAFEKYQLTFVICRECETLYMNPRPSPAILETYYSTSENYAYWNQYIFPASEETRRQKMFRPRATRLVETCRRYQVDTDLLLEVGAGFGTFCEEIRRLQHFKRVIAVEPTPGLADTCRGRGLEVIERPIEDVQLDESRVNVIASFETIEHLFSPENFLSRCATLLAPDGLIFLTCPNIKGFDLVVLKEASDTVDVEHLNYFHPSSLSNLLTRCGFEVLEVLTPGKLDAELVRKKVLEGEFTLSGQPFLQLVLMEEWERLGSPFQQFLASSLLSSHMWIVARNG